MKSDLIITQIEPHTDEWYAFRKNGIGGSEIGTVLGLDKYSTAIRLYHEKVGDVEMRREDNQYMFWGRNMEDKIAEIWKYYDGTDEGYIENFKNGKIVRDCRNVNGFVVNPKYPWLFASLDRLINIKGGRNLITGEPLKTEGVLECKTLSYWASQMWQDGIPISYLAQVHQYMIILESDYAEIAILQDGNKFRVEKVQRDDELCDRIIAITRAFWENRIMPGKEAFEKKVMAMSSGNVNESERWEGEIQRFEPDPDTTEAYREFQNERAFVERSTAEGTIEQYELCRRDVWFRRIVDRIDAERTRIKNIFARDMVNLAVEVIDFGRLGNVSWTERKGSKNRTMTIRIKENPTEEQIEDAFKEIDCDCW